MNQNHDEPRTVSFSDFVFLQSQQALLSMGQFPNPMTGKYEENLYVAQYVIDILSMLREKTKGNLNENETKLLENVLHELRMTYVEKSEEAEKKGTAKPEGETPGAESAQPEESEKEETPGAPEPEAKSEEQPESEAPKPEGPAAAETEEKVIQMPPPSDEESPDKPDKAD